MRASKIFRNTLLFAASTASIASASNAQGVAQGDATISNCQVGQTTGPDQACHNVVRTIEVSPGDVEAINRLLAEKGGRLATPEEVAAAWENLGLDTSAFYKMSDGRFAVPSQNGVGAVFQRGVNFRDSGVATFAKGVFYVDAQAPRPSSVAQVQAVVQGDISITPHNYDCGEGKFDAQPNSAEIKCIPQVYFYEVYMPQGTLQTDPSVLARERAWVLATPEEIQANVAAGKLRPSKPGRAAGGNHVEPSPDGSLNLNPQYVTYPSGFYYVLESAAGRVQEMPHRVFYGTDVRIPVDGLMASSSGWQTIPRPIPGAFWSSNIEDQHPAKALFGLGDAVLLRRAARNMLQKKGMSAGESEIEDFLSLAQTDSEARYALAVHLVGEAFGALSTRYPDPDQLNFRKAFEAYMSYERYRVNGITYDRWREFNGVGQFNFQESYGYSAPAANLLPKIPSASTFQSQLTNPMELGSNGADAIRALLDPAILAGTVGDTNFSLDGYGLDMAGVGVAAGLGGTIATAAGSLAIVAGSVGMAGTTTAVPIATTAVTSLMTVTQTVPGISYVAPNAGFLISKNVLAASSSTTLGSSAAIGVGISLALAALISKSFADLAMSEALDRDLRTKLDAGPQPVDVYQLLATPDAVQAQLNRSAVFGYVLKMLIADPVDKGLLTLERPPLPKIVLPEGEFPPVPGYVRLQNNWYKTSYVHNEGSKLTIGQVQPNWWSAMWKKVPTIGEWFVLQNRYRPSEYLHIQNGPLELGPIPGGEPWWSAQWREVPANDGWVRIQNRWKGDHYLNNSAGKIEAIPVQVNWASALWKVK